MGRQVDSRPGHLHCLHRLLNLIFVVIRGGVVPVCAVVLLIVQGGLATVVGFTRGVLDRTDFNLI